jgi:amidase
MQQKGDAMKIDDLLRGERGLNRRSFVKGALSAFGAVSAAPFPSVFAASQSPRVLSAAIDRSELVFASATDAALAIRRKTISSVELTQLLLDRIERYNPALNAIVTLLRDDALKRAGEADAALADGTNWGPLHGVPITIKDAFEIANVRTTAGAFREHVPGKDSVAVGRLRGAGAVILGHTNVPVMLADFQSYNPIFGRTNNPWNLERTPGGSSGGEAAALAAGLTYLSLGSDIAGSIRVPAHFCGVFGHKPSLNIVPLRGSIPPPPGGPPDPPAVLPVAGPLARNAADLKLALEILAGPEPEEARAYRWSLPQARGTRLSDYRIGYVLDDPSCPVVSDVKEVMVQVLEILRKGGARLVEGWPAGVVPSEQYDTYRYLLASPRGPVSLTDDQRRALEVRAKNQDGSFDAIRALALTASHSAYAATDLRRMAARTIWQDYFRTHDAFLLPAAFVAAFLHDPSEPQGARTLSTVDGPRRYMDLMFWISFATLAGLPATTAPVGLTRSRLPVGIQIIGPYLEDATPIDVASKVAELTGGFVPPEQYR